MATLPSTIGRYEIQAQIGQGGMGILYRAVDPRIANRPVAIKVLRIDDPQMRLRFEREARMIGLLEHPNIVTVYDVGDHDGQPFIAMKFIPGDTLAARIARRAPLPLRERLSLIEQLCDGLAYAHERGVIHRDIKPANLMVHRDSGRLLIVDFGIARAAATDTAITRLGALVGTPRFMAPEQLQGETVDHRSDIYAVGLVLYELLSYQPVFPGDVAALVAYRVVHESPRPLSEVEPAIPAALSAIVDHAIDKSPLKRYQSLRDLQHALAAVREDLGNDTLVSTPGVIPAPHLAPAEPDLDPSPVAAGVETDTNAEVDEWLQRAQDQLDRGNLAETMALGDRVLDTDPDNAEALRLREEVARARTLERQRRATDRAAAARASQSHDNLNQAFAVAERARAAAAADATDGVVTAAPPLPAPGTMATYEAPRRPSPASLPHRRPGWSFAMVAVAAVVAAAAGAFLASRTDVGPARPGPSSPPALGPTPVEAVAPSSGPTTRPTDAAAIETTPVTSADAAAIETTPVTSPDAAAIETTPVASPDAAAIETTPVASPDDAGSDPLQPTDAEPPAPTASPTPVLAAPAPPAPQETGAPPEPSPENDPPAGDEVTATPPPLPAERPLVPGGLQGTLRDPSGPVAGMTVRLVGAALPEALETTMSDTGAYQFIPLPPGEYTIVFMRDGDTVYERPELTIGEGQVRTLGVMLPPAEPPR